MARGIQQATIVLLLVPWLLVGSASFWYWSKFGRYDEGRGGDGSDAEHGDP